MTAGFRSINYKIANTFSRSSSALKCKRNIEKFALPLLNSAPCFLVDLQSDILWTKHPIIKHLTFQSTCCSMMEQSTICFHCRSHYRRWFIRYCHSSQSRYEVVFDVSRSKLWNWSRESTISDFLHIVWKAHTRWEHPSPILVVFDSGLSHANVSWDPSYARSSSWVR